MIINLAENLLTFLEQHNLDTRDIEYVGYQSGVSGEISHCTFLDFLEVAEDINFEDYDPLVKHREPIKNQINIVAEQWFVATSNEPDTLWSYSELPIPMGVYEPICEEDIIDEVDVIDEWTSELLSNKSPNLDYVRDTIDIAGKTYKIDGINGLEKIVDDNNRTPVILACNPNGRYWTVQSTTFKDPQILYHPELVKIVIEYRQSHPIEGYQLADGNIMDVFDIEELSDKYNLDFGTLSNQHFNNLQVVWVPKGVDYIIDFSGASSHEDLRHEVIYPVGSMNIVSV